MPVAFTNFASTQLASGITDVATSMTVMVTTGANFPTTSATQWFYVVLTDSLVSPTQREVVKVSTRAGDTFSVCVRARDGTTALTWASGTYCQLRLTAGTFADLTAQFANNADNLSALTSASSARTNLGLGTMATQAASAVAITGGTIAGATLTTAALNGTLGATTPSTIAATTIDASGVIASTLATGTAPFTVASTTVVGNLNVSQLLGATWTAPGTIGSVTPSSGAFTTLSATGAVSGVGFSNYLASPPAIGGGAAAAGTFTTLTAQTIRATTSINYRGGDNASATNSGFGEGALDSNAGGTNNTAAGNNALTANIAGGFNSAFGSGALSANTSGQSNAAFGYGCLALNTTGSSNIAIGIWALQNSLSSVENIAIGSESLRNAGGSTTAGSFVIGVEYTIQTSGSTNFSAVGAADNNPGTVFIASGVGSGTGTASATILGNVAIGTSTLRANLTGNNNAALGSSSLVSNEWGNENIAVGAESLDQAKNGSRNVAVGYRSLTSLGSGVSAGSFIVNNQYAIYVVGTTDYTLIGSANNNVGTVFTATGIGAGTGAAVPVVVDNTCVGNESAGILTEGIRNTIIGASATTTSTNQKNSTAIGYQATATLDNQVVLGNASVVEYKLPGTTAHVKYAGSYSSGAPVTETTATHTVAVSTSSLICNRAGTITVTLPSAATFSGRELRIKTITANTVVSNASNVRPLIGGAAGTAICAGVAGSWAHLHSDGTDWIIMAGA